jgi:hypothetical protein
MTEKITETLTEKITETLTEKITDTPTETLTETVTETVMDKHKTEQEETNNREYGFCRVCRIYNSRFTHLYYDRKKGSFFCSCFYLDYVRPAFYLPWYGMDRKYTTKKKGDRCMHYSYVNLYPDGEQKIYRLNYRDWEKIMNNKHFVELENV